MAPLAIANRIRFRPLLLYAALTLPTPLLLFLLSMLCRTRAHSSAAAPNTGELVSLAMNLSLPNFNSPPWTGSFYYCLQNAKGHSSIGGDPNSTRPSQNVAKPHGRAYQQANLLFNIYICHSLLPSMFSPSKSKNPTRLKSDSVKYILFLPCTPKY